ncbi:aldehyde dehydrogenase family protein [Rhizobium beringeri]
MPAGVVNIVTGSAIELAKILAAHNDVDALWAFGSAELSATVEKLSSGNLKRTFVDNGKATDWMDRAAGEGTLYLRRAVDVKNIWIPLRRIRAPTLVIRAGGRTRRQARTTEFEESQSCNGAAVIRLCFAARGAAKWCN